MPHLSPVVVNNDGALVLVHSDRAHVPFPWGQGEQQLALRWETLVVMLTVTAARQTSLCATVPSESTDAILSMSPARARAREDFPTPFWPRSAILSGPSCLPSKAAVRVSSTAGLKLMGEADAPTAPGVHSQSSWTASSLLSWCLMGSGVLPLRTVGVLDRVMLSH